MAGSGLGWDYGVVECTVGPTENEDDIMTCARPVFALMLGAVLAWGCASEPPAGNPATDVEPTAGHPEQALIDDLVLAYRIFAKELDILDTAGHVSVRSQLNPNHYFMSRYLAPGAATASDIIENDLDSHAVAGPRTDPGAGKRTCTARSTRRDRT